MDLPLPNRNLKDVAKYGEFDGLRVANADGPPSNADKDKSMEVSKPLSETNNGSAEEQTSSLTKLKVVEKLLDLTTGKDTFYKV